MVKKLSDVLKGKLEGVKSSTVTPGSLGTRPGVDYMPKAPSEQDFVAAHTFEKHAGRVGNDADVYNGGKIKYSMDTPQMKNFGHKKGDDEKAYNEVKSPTNTGKEVGETIMKIKNITPGQTVKEETSKKTLNEILTKSTPAGEWIKDFIDSDNPKFAGKSKERRKQMALAAYYAKQRNEEVEQIDMEEDIAVPLLGGDIAKNKTDDTQDEIAMVKSELKAIANKAMHMLMSLPTDMHIEPWVQAKIAMAKEILSGVHDYMIYGHGQSVEKEADSQMDITSSGSVPQDFPGITVDYGKIV